MRVLAFVAAAIALGPQPARAIAVHLDAGVLTASLAAALTNEKPVLQLVDLASEADLLVFVEDRSASLLLRVETPSGDRVVERVIDRRVDASESLAPALRLVVLVVVETIEGWAASAGPRGGPRARLGLTLGASTWSDPGAPQLGIGARGGLIFAPLTVDLLVAVAPCCALETPGVVSGTPLSLTALAEASLAWASLGPLEALASAGVGVGWRRVSGVSLAYAAPAPEESQAAVEVLARAALGLAWAPVERLAVELRAGAEVRPTRLRISLPPPYAGGETAVDPGVIAPFLELLVAARIF